MPEPIKVRLNLRGLNTVMTSAPLQKDVDERGRRMAAAAGPEFEYVARPHSRTARGFVQPKSARGARQEALEKRLTRSLDAGR